MLLIAHGKTVPAQAPGRGPLAIRFGASIRCIALAAAIVLPAQAAESPASLAAAVLDLERQALAADARQLTLYIGNRSEGSLLREVVVMVDGRAAARHRYSDREARALRAGLHPLVVALLDEGRHRLRVEFVARAEDAQPGDVRQYAQIEQDYVKTAAAGRVELVMDKQGLRGKYGIQWQDWAQPAAALEDPRLRAADYYLRSDQPLAAALLLERLRGEGLPLPATFDRRMADSLAALGLAAPSGLAGTSPVLERYGRSVAALQQGDAQAAAQLEAIGAAEAQDGETLMLRDYANLELGYQLLRQGEGERAKPVLARIRSPGPCSNAALLGFGWAFLVPKAGEGDGSMFTAQAPLWPASAEDAARLRRNMPFRYLHSVAVAGERKLDLQRALIPWVELLGRDATDPAVQEGMLAVPYALAHLGAHEQSQQYTRRAIDQLERARSDLDAAMKHVSGGELAALLQQRMTDDSDGWRRELVDLPYADATAYLKPLMQDPAFLAAVSAQQRLAQIDQALHGDEAGVAALRQRVAVATQAQRAELQNLALARLRAQRQHTLAYLAEARLALARVHDRPLEGEPS